MEDIQILIVDDNPSIHNDIRKVLEPDSKQKKQLIKIQSSILGTSPEKPEFRFLMDSVYQGEDAVQLIRQRKIDHRTYALAYVDIRMPPGIDGIETVRQIFALDSDIQIVLCSAYSDYSLDDITKILGVTDRLLILKKPFENIEVQQMTATLAKKMAIK